MAKGLRSSARKSNRSKLRTKVFEPVEKARTERLSQKLTKLASESNSHQDRDARFEEEVC